MATATTATAAATLGVVGLGAETASGTRTLDAIHQAGSRVVGGIKGIAFTAPGNERQANGLTLGIGSIVLLDRCVCVLETGICDMSNSLRTTGAVVGESEFRNGSDTAEKVLLNRRIVNAVLVLGRAWLHTYIEIRFGDIVV